MSKNHNKAFGIVLSRLRHQRNVSQEVLGFDADLTRAYISLLERGQRSPTLDTLFQIGRALDVPITEIASLILAELRDGTNGS